MRRAAALIVGGGPAGSAAAIVLARGGVRAELHERSRGDRDVVCGGFLGWDAIARLRRLGVEPETLGARPIRRLRLCAGGAQVETTLPSLAAGLSRRRLDSALLAAAEQAGTRVVRGHAARAVEAAAVRFDDGESVTADALFLATGKHELRGAARPVPSGTVAAAGLRTALPPRPELERALAETIELHLFDGGYAGLLLQEDGSANLCLSIARARLAAAAGPTALFAELAAESPIFARRLDGFLPERWDAVAGVPYGWRARAGEAGLFRVGDQAAVIASLAGDGIAIALASGEAAAHALLAGGPDAASGYQAAFARQAARPVRLAELFRRSAERASSRRPMMRLLRLVPGAAGIAARLTRIG
ncbi:NAD(P)/FAD-dependent oxidoreductase [Sphingosinicella terrae]|uniref:NAD(P)/FAD-dependent oxidoreductase n=1 Tax=Sphingosinicella terrae TaxID=2172047 RepID=UPI000E0D5C85|nr:FAD-dependent monooxygenase [Sphingosinicella terrae]